MTNFSGQIPVGTPSPAQAITVTVVKAGLLNVIDVVSQGNANIDFTSTNTGSCTAGVSYLAGQTCTVGVTFQPRYPGLRVGAVVLAAQDGTVLGQQMLSGTGVGALGTFVPGEITTFAGHAAWLYNGDGELAINASIFLPFGIAVDTFGNVYIADSANNRIRKVTAATGVISTFAGTGTLGDSGDGGPAMQALLSGPTSVALDGAGNLYVCDSGNNVVRKIVAGTGIITKIAGTNGQQGYTGDGGQATLATLSTPNGIALDAAGNLFIADTANSVIRRVDAVTGVITTVAGTGKAGFNGDNILAKTAQLNGPWSVTPDASGNLYIADQGNHRIREVNPAGVIATIVGTGSAGFSGDGGPATQAAINAPASAIVDVAGNIYVSDAGNNRVRKVNASSGNITTIAGTTTQSISGDNGPATSAGLYGPYTLALDGPGNLYIADVFHNRVRVVYANDAVLDYLPMRIGRVAAAQQQTIENDGNATLNISSVQAVSDSVIDSTTTTCASAMALSPLSSCVIGASFAPTSLGTPLVGVIALNSDAVNNPGTLNLSGNVLDEDPSTVTLAASANPIQVGNSVYFTVTVASAGVVPTGQVTLLDGANPIGTANLQAGGVATFNISTLTGGQHSMTASYTGDSNNTPGVSSSLIETVQDVSAPTQTTLAVSANPALAGAQVVLAATVAVVTPGSGSGTISGSVTFTDGSTIIGAGTVTNGTASFATSTLAVGQHSIVASYSGVSTYSASYSAPLTVVVQAGTTNTVLTSSANPSPGGGTVVFTASVASNGTLPTGTITFLDGANPIGSALLNQVGVSTLQASTLAVGTHNIVALYSGDMLNNGSASSAVVQIVNLAATTAVVTSSLTPAPQGAPVTLSATLTSTGGIPGGTVEFFDGTVSLGKATLSPTGVGTVVSATLGIGTHTITASYYGDALDGISTSAVFNQVIVAATTTVAFTAAANPAAAGSPNVFTVVVQGTGTQPVGNVTLQDGGVTIGTQLIDSTGTAVFANTSLAIGVHNLVAQYSGDADHAPNFASLTERVVQVTGMTLVSSSSTAIAGTQVSLTAIVTGLSSQPLTGSIQFKDGAAIVATIPLGANGSAVFSSSNLSIGAHPITTVYSGDTLDQASTSNTVLQTIQIATTSTSLTTNANPSFAGANLNIVAAVTGNGATPTGTVTFSDSGTVLSVVSLTMGAASLSMTTLAPGLHSLTASYSGDVNDTQSVSTAISESIVQQTVLSVTSSANPSMFQNNVTISVTVSGGLAAYPPTGTITLNDGAAVVGNAAVNALGSVQFTMNAPALGQHVLTASYSGDVHNSPAVAPSLTQSVILRPTTNSFVTSSSAVSAGQSVTFISLVQGVGPNFPTGMVTFVSGSTVLGTATLNVSGLATLTFVPLQGVYSVIAQYPGDTLFAASNSTATSVVVGPTTEFTINSTPAAISLQRGEHTTLQISIVTAPTFTDTLQLGCAGLPALATCTFSTNNVKVVGGGTANLSVVLDTGSPLGAGARAQLTSHASGTAVACILPGGALFALLLFRPRRFRKQLSALAMALVLCTLTALSGCASSLNINDTAAGNYSFQIIGTGATTDASQAGTVSLTVTQ